LRMEEEKKVREAEGKEGREKKSGKEFFFFS
jgi:hypothetical protein